MAERDSAMTYQAATLPELFYERVKCTPQHLAYRHFDKENKVWQSTTWAEMSTQVARWQTAFRQENLKPGDCVAIMLRNSPHWVMFDQAALSLGLTTVPLYTDDRADNVAYILAEAEVKLLLLEGHLQWKRLYALRQEFPALARIVTVQSIDDKSLYDSRVIHLEDWLPIRTPDPLSQTQLSPHSLASIVYTSGTTGRPKGVMLSHHNILSNVKAVTQAASEGGRYLTEQDLFLSFLPLSHMLERTAGYYVPMLIGATVAYARSIPQLSMDLVALSPTVLISVPRIYEQVHDKIQSQLAKKTWLARQLFNLTLWVGRRHFEYTQGRVKWLPIEMLWPPLRKLVAEPLLKKLGGRIRLAICGGAALPPPVAKLFTGVGLTLLQGYGLTESSPVITVNRPLDNVPASIGTPLPDVAVKQGDNDELLTKSDCVMLGYWKNPVATQNVIDADGWLHTGDKACQDEHGHWYITGRIKDIIVMGNGEKIPPGDMEMMIATDTLFEQVMVLGEGKPFLSALVVLNSEQWQQFAKTLQVDAAAPDSLQAKLVQKAMLTRIRKYVRTFPGYAQIRRVTLLQEPWTIENGLLTPTLKMKRARILERYATQIEQMYKGF